MATSNEIPPREEDGPADETPLVNGAMAAAFARAGTRTEKNEPKPRPLSSGVPGPEDGHSAKKENVVVSGQPEAPVAQPQSDPWREKGGLIVAEKEIRRAVEIMNGGAMPPDIEKGLGEQLTTLRAAVRGKNQAAFNEGFKNMRTLYEPYLSGAREKLANLKDPPPAKPEDIAYVQSLDKKGREKPIANPVAADSTPSSIEQPEDSPAENPSAIPTEDSIEVITPSAGADTTRKEQNEANRKTLRDLLAEYGQIEGLESNYNDAGLVPEKPKGPQHVYSSTWTGRGELPPEAPPAAKPEWSPLISPAETDAKNQEQLRVDRAKRITGAAGAVKPNPIEALDPIKGAGIEKDGSRGEKMLGWLKTRNEALNVQAEKLGGKKLEQMFRATGEWYNQQNKWAKIGIGLGIGAGAALSLPFSSTLAGAFGVAIAGQRVLGGLGRFTTIEKNLQKAHGGEEIKGWMVPKAFGIRNGYKWLSQQSEGVRSGAAVVLAAMYALGFSAAVGEVVDVVGTDIIPGLEHLWPHHAAMPTPAAAGLHAADAFKIPPQENLPPFHGGVADHAIDISHGSMPQAHDIQVVHPAGVPGAPANEFVVADIKGGGYEKLAQMLRLKLEQSGMTADHAQGEAKDLLSGHLTKAVHDLAIKHGFYHADGTNVAIPEGSTLSLDAHGNIVYNAGGHGEGMADAPPHAPTTHPLNEVRARLGLQPKVLPPDQLQAQELAKIQAEANSYIAAHPPEAPPMHPTEVPPMDAPHYVPPRAAIPGAESGVASPDLSHVGAQDTHYHGSADTAPSVEPSHIAPGTEAGQIQPPTTAIEHTQAFVNANKLPIDPNAGHVFEDGQHAALAYGNDFDARFSAAQDYVKANHSASVWVQAKDPVFYNGAWRPWVFEVKYKFLSGVQAILPNGPPDPSQIGGINPDSFTKQLDAKP